MHGQQDAAFFRIGISVGVNNYLNGVPLMYRCTLYSH